MLILYSTNLLAQKKGNYQQQIESIAEQITSITNKLNIEKAQLKTEQDVLLREERKISQLNQDIKQLESAISNKSKEIELLTSREQTLLQEGEVDRVAMLALIRQRYIEGKSHYLKMLLDQENPYAVGRLQNYYDYFQQAQQKKLNYLQNQATTLAKLKETLNEQHTELQLSKRNQQNMHQTLGRSQKKRQLSVNKLFAKVEQSSKKLNRLKADRERLRKLLKQLAVQAEKLKQIEKQRKSQPEVSRDNRQQTVLKGGFLKQKGRLKAPVRGTLKYRYGSRLVESGMRAEGVFFNTPESRKVHSIFAGRVLFADFLKGYGLLIIVDHGDQHISLYGHNELLYKKVGDMVAIDEVISKSGTTGGLREAGLYFEIRKNATPVDPAKWCQL